LIPRISAGALLAWLCWAAPDPVAARLAREAHQAQNAGQVVRAYLLYAEAAARDPQNPTYRANRDALAPAANLLTKADVQKADISEEIKAAEKQSSGTEPPIELASRSDWERNPDLQPIPHLQPSVSSASFDFRGDEKTLFERVTSAFGIRPTFDPQFEFRNDIRFNLTQADFRTAMEALTAVTDTFLFPISQHDIFIARDTELKRNEYEPRVLLTFPLPNALDQKDLLEAANAVRGVLRITSFGWDSSNRIVMIRDRYTRARVARALLEAVLLPKAQVSLEVQFLTYDAGRNYHYGTAMQTSFPILYFGGIGHFQTILPTFTNPIAFLGFGGGATLFGLGLTNATLFAIYSNSFSRKIFDATAVADDGETVNFHVGDKYPIPQSLYTGFQQSTPSIYNPIGEVTLEDLGLILKMTPRITADGDVTLDVEADYKALGALTLNTVPSIDERQFKGTVTIREGQWAVIMGMDEETHNTTRSGLVGLSQIPGLNHLLAENTRDTQSSKTLVVIKPTITRLPMSSYISPQYLLGPERGERVLL
jgi:general secretion pathway protein D